MQKYAGNFSIGNSLSKSYLLTLRLETKFLNSEDFLFEGTYNEIELEFHSKQIWFSQGYFVRTARLELLFCGYLIVCVSVRERERRERESFQRESKIKLLTFSQVRCK